MIDLQTAADGIGRLRVRHVGGTEGILAEISFSEGPVWLDGYGTRKPLERPHAVFSVALDEGGRLEAPQASFEVAGS